MDKELLRCELIKLVYKPTSILAADDAIVQAKKLEAYCLQSGEDTAKVPAPEIAVLVPEVKPPSPPPKEVVPVKGKVPAKKSDNSIFS